MLDILVTEVVLDCPRVAAIVGRFVAASMAQHVRMSLEGEAGLGTEPCDHPTYTDANRVFSMVRRIESRKEDRHSPKPSFRFCHFYKNGKGGKRDD